MSREKILTNIRKNKPTMLPLPKLHDFSNSENNLDGKFIQTVEAMGGNVFYKNKNQSLAPIIEQHFPHEKNILSTVEYFSGNINLEEINSPVFLKNVDLAILSARIGVAENGAVWLTEKEMGYRVLPFICQHLLVVLNKENLVENMHQAYQKINVAETGFGVFIAGPSKTADIEQSLVIGAQGARSFTVLLMGRTKGWMLP